MLRSTKITGGRGNPFSAIGANAFSTTNTQSRSAMRGTRRDGQPAYPVISYISWYIQNFESYSDYLKTQYVSAIDIIVVSSNVPRHTPISYVQESQLNYHRLHYHILSYVMENKHSSLFELYMPIILCTLV